MKKVGDCDGGCGPWLHLYETSLHTKVKPSQFFFLYIWRTYIYPTHDLVCMCIRVFVCNLTPASAAHVVVQDIGSVVPVSYNTYYLNLILAIDAKGWKRVIGEPVRHWNRYRGDDWSSGHPTKFSDRLTQPAGTYRHATSHVIKFMAIFKNFTRYISFCSRRNKHKLIYFREVTSNPLQQSTCSSW